MNITNNVKFYQSFLFYLIQKFEEDPNFYQELLKNQKTKEKTNNMDTSVKFFSICTKVHPTRPFDWLADLITENIDIPHKKEFKKYVFIIPWTKWKKNFKISIGKELRERGFISIITLKNKNIFIKNRKLEYIVKMLPFGIVEEKGKGKEKIVGEDADFIRLQEIFVSVSLNLLQSICKNFVMTYTVTTSKKKITLNTSQKRRYFFLIMEYLDITVMDKIKEFLNKGDLKKLDEFIRILFLQLIYGLYCANKELKFLHTDLYNINNVMIKYFKEPKDCIFKFDDTHIFEIKKCPFLVKIIDFGLSYVEPVDLDEILKGKENEERKENFKYIFNNIVPSATIDLDKIEKRFNYKFKKNLKEKLKSNDLFIFLHGLWFVLQGEINPFNDDIKDFLFNARYNQDILQNDLIKVTNDKMFQKFKIKELPKNRRENDESTFIYKPIDLIKSWQNLVFCGMKELIKK